MVQIKKGNNRRYMGEPLHLWGEGNPPDVDGNPAYFDRIIDDICDRDMGDPMSAVGVPFRLFLGAPNERYIWADFMAHGVRKFIGKTGVPEYRLQWERLTEWKKQPKPNNLDTVEPQIAEANGGDREVYVKGDGEVKWNPGKQLFEVIVNGEIVHSCRDKEEANQVASGDRPL